MKIDLSTIDRNMFYVNEHVINGEVCHLVTPQQMGCEWTQENKIFRSSLWNDEGELISASFPKFVNWGEKPEVFPLPSSLKNATIVEKMDGSTLIVSKYKGNFIIRTRGTVDASRMEKNGHEIAELLQKYPIITTGSTAFFNSYQETWDFSLIFEWTSPLNVIVLNYGVEADIKLIGVVEHLDYSLWTQVALDLAARDLGVGRPTTYTFSDVTDLLQNIEKWEDKEGVCVYHRNGQEIHKVKAAKYLMLHRMKSELGSLEAVVDVWIEQNYPDYNTFYNYIATTFDYELAEQCRGHISRIADGYKEVQQIVNHMQNFVADLSKVSRKDAAQKILAAYGNTNRASFCFTLLDGRSLVGKDIKKLLFQVLKK